MTTVRHGVVVNALAAVAAVCCGGGTGGGSPVQTCTVDRQCSGEKPSCTEWFCDDNGGLCNTRPAMKGTACGDRSVCLADGSCVDRCQNQQKDDDETDVDCGRRCPGCANGRNCIMGTDCAAGICLPTASGSRCALPGCNDHVLNGDETDVDCGGSCPPCIPGRKCGRSKDCDSGRACLGGFCCGAPCPEICFECAPDTGACYVAVGRNPGGGCPEDTDTCDNAGRCGLCGNLLLNPTNHETDVDCGGNVCPACQDGKRCREDSDCQSCLCDSDSHECRPAGAHCGDHVKNHCETDVDCGGPCGATCSLGDNCNSKADCQSDYCQDSRCHSP